MKENQQEGGFSLLEVVITLSILVSLIIAVTQLMRTSFDVRLGLAAETNLTHRVNSAIQRLSSDLAHAYVLNSKDRMRTQGQRRAMFRIEKSGRSDSLQMTFMGHRALKANAKEGDQSYVIYEVRPSEKFPQRSHLYRGELPRVPEEAWKYKESPPMRLIAENIESIRLDPWNGDDWARDRWDSTQGDGIDRLPSMVRITIRAWADEGVEGVEPDENAGVVQFNTVVYLSYSGDFDELKMKNNTFKY